MPQLKDLTVQWVSLVDRAAVRDPSNPSEPQRFLLWKADGGATTTDPTEGGNVSEAELRAALEKAEAERDEAVAKAEELEKKLAKKATKKAEKEEPEAINKDELDPRVREALEKAEAQAKAAEERLTKAEKLAKAERDLRIEKEFIAKAEDEFKHVSGDASEFGKLLKSMSEKLSEDEFSAVQSRLRSAEEIARVSDLFKEAGRGGDPIPTTAGDSDLAKLEKAAEDLRKSDSSLSQHESMMAAMRKYPELQAAYLAANR